MPVDPATTKRVRDGLQKLKFTRALVIDDSLKGRGEDDLTEARWLEVVEVLDSEDSETLDKVKACFKKGGFDSVEREIPDAVLEETKGIVAGSTSNRAKELMATKREAQPELERLISYLEALGVEVVTLPSPQDAPKDIPLIFLDYNINEDEESEGTAATEFLKKLMAESGGKKAPPVVVLMSRHDPKQERWEVVAEESAYLRFCFRYRDKTILAADEPSFLFHLEELLEAAPLGEAYLKHLNALEPEIMKLVKSVVKELMGLTPADFRSFAQLRLKDADGTKRASHLRYLLTKLLELELRSSADVEQALVEFGKTLAETAVRQSDYESVALHDLQGRILYDRSESVKKAPLSFGDIYIEGEGERCAYLIVLTPECDLEPRGEDGKPKAEHILFLEAACKKTRQQGDALECTPLMREAAAGPCQWLVWNLRRPVTVPYDDVGAKLKKWVLSGIRG